MAGIDTLLVLALEHRVASDQLCVLEDAHLCRVVLHLDDPAPGGVRHAVLVAPDGDHALLANPALDRQGRVIGLGWQGNEMRLFFGKMFIHDPLRGGMDPRIGDGHAPILELGVQVVEVTEAAPQEEVLPNVADGTLDLARRPMGSNQWRLNGQLFAR